MNDLILINVDKYIVSLSWRSLALPQNEEWQKRERRKQKLLERKVSDWKKTAEKKSHLVIKRGKDHLKNDIKKIY